MRATSWYFLVVTVLFVAQVLLGIVTAHYAVEGQGLYGLPLSEYFPYAVTRTWHTQLAVLWIATAWLGTGLYVAPMLGGREPKLQAAGVWFLLVSLVVIVAGSFAGEWLAINRMIGDAARNFWFGHQGYEYVDLGRFWQIYLFVGLLLWVALVLARSLAGAAQRTAEPLAPLPRGRRNRRDRAPVRRRADLRAQHPHLDHGVLALVGGAPVGRGRVRGIRNRDRLSVARADGARAGVGRDDVGARRNDHLSRRRRARHVPPSLLERNPDRRARARQRVFALEVVPLLVVGFEAYSRAKHEGLFDWQKAYRWPFMFFGAVLVWNLIGAGLFGFLINPPLALYYMQGLNTTATHGHAALFGVYGMLGLGLTLFCMRGLTDVTRWSERLLATSFWCLNVGLAMMVFLSLLPQGLWQTYASFTRDYAYARSAEVIQGPVMQALVWARVPGDLVFAVGVLAFAAFVVRAFSSARTARVAKAASGTYAST